MKESAVGNGRIWAVGGGKGGVGKSLVISSIAISLALKGEKTVLIDADFGGANLHSFLGISRPDRTLTDFFIKKTPLAELVIDSSIPNLGLVVGVISSFTPENINHAQKQKFLRHIQMLEADAILVDLGAGASFNIIDTYLVAGKKLAVILPEVTAIDNMYSFLKYAFFRKLVQAFSEKRIQYVILDAYKEFKEGGQGNSGNLSQFIDYLQSLGPEAGQIVRQVLSDYEIHIIVNQAKSKQDIALGDSVKSVCRKYLGFQSRYLGCLEHEESVPASINSRQPFLLSNPSARFSEEIARITNNLLQNEQVRLR